MSVQISAMKNSHCGLKRRGFRLVTAVTLSLSINQGMDWTGQSSIPEDARDTLNAESSSKKMGSFFRRLRKKPAKKLDARAAVHPAEGEGTSTSTDREKIKGRIMEAVEACYTMKGAEKENALEKLQAIAVEEEKFLRNKCHDRDHMFDCFTVSHDPRLQEVAAIMTSVPHVSNWSPYILIGVVRSLTYGPIEIVVDKNIKAAIEIVSCFPIMAGCASVGFDDNIRHCFETLRERASQDLKSKDLMETLISKIEEKVKVT